MAATKINLTKISMHCTIIANAVRGHSYENFFTQKFIIRKFLCTKISRSTVLHSLYTIGTAPAPNQPLKKHKIIGQRIMEHSLIRTHFCNDTLIFINA